MREGTSERDDLAELAAWREAFQAPRADQRPETDVCPAPERIWEAVEGKLSPTEIRKIVDHTASHAVCAQAWRLAAELQRDLKPAPEKADKERSARPLFPARWAAAAAVAATAVLAVGLLVQRASIEDTQVVQRAGAVLEIGSLVERSSLPRDGFRLAWEGGPEGSTYEVLLTDSALNTVARAGGLESPEWLVPESKLQGLESGSELYWRVEMTGPQGEKNASPSFDIRLE